MQNRNLVITSLKKPGKFLESFTSIFFFLLFYSFGGHFLLGNPFSLVTSFPVEGVLLHSDRDIYVTGEYLHLKTFLWNTPGWEGPTSQIVYYDLVSGNKRVVSGIMAVNNFQSDANIYLHDTLSSGFYQLIAYTHWMRNSDMENFFKKTIFLANRFDNDLKTLEKHTEINADNTRGVETMVNPNQLDTESSIINIDVPDTLAKREQVSITVSLAENGFSLNGLSVTVAREESFFPYVFNSQNRELYVRKWMESSVSEANFFMEDDHYLLEGSIKGNDSINADKIHIILTTPDDSLNMLQTSLNPDGNFVFALPPAYRGKELYISKYPYNPDNKYTIHIHEKRIPFDHFDWQENSDIFIDRKYVRQSQSIVKARIAYQKDYLEEQDMAVQNIELLPRIYGKPATSISLADYIPFDDLQDISREIIPSWRIRSNRDQFYRSRLVDETTGLTIDDNPAFFIDGIYCYNLDPLLYLNSDLLSRIEIHNRHWVHGNLAFPGIVALFSRGNEYLKIVKDLPVYRYKFDFFQKTMQFIPPVYSRNEPIQADQPDLRQLLYWNPQVDLSQSPNTQISISTGDLTGSFIIQLLAMDENGNIVEGKKRFIVK
jgi:hypothetical protein